MVRAGWSPSVRLFEAAACGVPIISDYWPGLEEFFEPGRDIVVGETLEAFRMKDSETRAMGERAREAILRKHTAANRASGTRKLHYDQVSSRKARANGHGRASAFGADDGRASERGGSRAIGAPGAQVANGADRGNIQQPARTGTGNGRSAEHAAPGLRSGNGTRLRRVDGQENR